MSDHWDFYGPYQISINKVYVKNNYHAYDLSIFEDRLALSYLVEAQVKHIMDDLYLWQKLSLMIARTPNETKRD